MGVSGITIYNHLLQIGKSKRLDLGPHELNENQNSRRFEFSSRPNKNDFFLDQIVTKSEFHTISDDALFSLDETQHHFSTAKLQQKTVWWLTFGVIKYYSFSARDIL